MSTLDNTLKETVVNFNALKTSPLNQKATGFYMA